MSSHPVAQLVAGVVLAVCTLGACVALYLTGSPEGAGAVLGFVGPFVAALLVSGKVEHVTRAQNETLATISKQTNGVLDARIRDGVTAVLDAAGVIGQLPAQRTDEQPAAPEAAGQADELAGADDVPAAYQLPAGQ